VHYEVANCKTPRRLLTPSPQAGLGDVESGAAQGTNTLLSGGANNAVSSTGNSVADLSNSAGNLINRSPEAQVGVSTTQSCEQEEAEISDFRRQTGLGDIESGAAQGTNTLLSGGVNNAVNSAGNSVADLSSSAGNLINRSPEAQAVVSELSKTGLLDHQANDPIPDRPRRC
jgi:hypothetical protein